MLRRRPAARHPCKPATQSRALAPSLCSSTAKADFGARSLPLWCPFACCLLALFRDAGSEQVQGGGGSQGMVDGRVELAPAVAQEVAAARLRCSRPARLEGQGWPVA